MPAYQVRNNTRNTIPVQTRGGFRRLKSGEVRILNLLNVNGERMRQLQQGAQLTIVPAINRDGKPSKPLPKLHLSAGRRFGAMPAMSLPPSAAPGSVVVTPGSKQLSVAFTAPAGSTSVQIRVSGADNRVYGAWATATSPRVLTGLVSSGVYSVQLRGVNIGGSGPVATVTGTPT